MWSWRHESSVRWRKPTFQKGDVGCSSRIELVPEDDNEWRLCTTLYVSSQSLEIENTNTIKQEILWWVTTIQREEKNTWHSQTQGHTYTNTHARFFIQVTVGIEIKEWKCFVGFSSCYYFHRVTKQRAQLFKCAGRETKNERNGSLQCIENNVR